MPRHPLDLGGESDEGQGVHSPLVEQGDSVPSVDIADIVEVAAARAADMVPPGEPGMPGPPGPPGPPGEPAENGVTQEDFEAAVATINAALAAINERDDGQDLTDNALSETDLALQTQFDNLGVTPRTFDAYQAFRAMGVNPDELTITGATVADANVSAVALTNTTGGPRNWQIPQRDGGALTFIVNKTASNAPITVSGQPGNSTVTPTGISIGPGEGLITFASVDGTTHFAIQPAGFLALTGGIMQGNIDLNTIRKIVNMPTPTASGDGAPKSYVDAQTALRLALAGGTMTGTFTGAAGSATVPSVGVGGTAAGLALVSNILQIIAGSTAGITVSNTNVTIPTTRTLNVSNISITRSLALSSDYVRDQATPYTLQTVMGNTGTSMSITVYDEGAGEAAPTPSYYPRSAVIDRGGPNEEYIVCNAAPSYNAGTGMLTLTALRAKPMGTIQTHAVGETFEWTDNFNVMHGFIIPNLTGPPLITMLQGFTNEAHDPCKFFVPPRGSWSGWSSPVAGYLAALACEDLPFARQLIEPLNGTVLCELPAGEKGTMAANYNAAAFDYYPFIEASR